MFNTDVCVCVESLAFEDGQAVQLEDGSTAFIHHAPKGVALAVYTHSHDSHCVCVTCV